MFFERVFFSLQRAESEGFLGCGIVEAIGQLFVNGTHEGEEEGVQVPSGEVSGGNWGDGKKVEDETVRHDWLMVGCVDFSFPGSTWERISRSSASS